MSVKVKCKNCGAEIDSDSKFCSVCGSAISDSESISVELPQQHNNSTDGSSQTEDLTLLEESIQELRRNIIETINATPSEKYLLARYLFGDAEKCFPDGPFRWDLADFYIDLKSGKLFAEVSTYPNQFGACREDSYGLTATEFHKKAIENNMSDMLKRFETDEDWQKLFDKDLNDAISNATAKIQKEKKEKQEKKRKENAIEISNEIASQCPTMEIKEINIILSQAYAISSLTVENKNGKYQAEYSSVSTISHSNNSSHSNISHPNKRSYSKELSVTESVWLEGQIESVLKNKDNSTWHSLPGGDKMNIVIKGSAGDIVNLHSTEPIKKFSDLMHEISKLIQYGSTAKESEPIVKTDKCKKCGTEIDLDSKFCPTCGTAIQAATPESTTTPQYTYSSTPYSQSHAREWVEKTKRNAKTLKIIMIVSLFVPLFGVMIAMIIGLVYLNKFGYFLRSVKDLEKSNRLDYVDDIPINTSTLVGSKIDCGSKAMYFQKIHQIIAYEDVLWIYIKRQNNNFYGLTVSSIETVEIWCRNKRHLSISAGRDEISQLINNYISKASPSLLVGYTPENAKQYSALKDR